MEICNWISHRGLWKYSDENSTEAFAKAIDVGFNQLETDLRMSADGHIVLCHDVSLRRVVGNNSKNIHEMKRTEIEKIRLKNGNSILFLEKFLKDFSNYKLIFDVKPETGSKVIEALPRYLNMDNSNHIEFLFWDHKLESQFKKVYPHANVLANEHQCLIAGISALLHFPLESTIKNKITYSLPPKFLVFNLYRKNIVNYYKKRNGRIISYLPNSQLEVDLAYKLGIRRFLLNDNFIIKTN